MYILKNAFTSITRNKGRNILIGIIIFIIACTTAVSLSIMNAANKLVDSYSNKYDIEATITIDRQKMMGNFEPGGDKEKRENTFNSIQKLSISDIENYGDSEYVKKYYYTYSISMNSDNITKASSNSSNMEHRGHMEMENSADFNIVGYSSYEAMSEFIEGKYVIKEGEVSEDFAANNCIINEELATLNNISVGDIIILVNPDDETKKYELTVTGIFSDNDEENGMNMFTNSVNSIITNTNVVGNILNENSDLNYSISPTFILNNEDSITKYEEELKEKGLDEYYTLSTNLDNISSETKSIENVASFSKTFLILTLIIGGVILFVINMINVRERKYEIGVLRTIGMKKSLVITQFVTELLIVAIIALMLGGLTGSLISAPTSNKLLESEIQSSLLLVFSYHFPYSLYIKREE